MAQDFQRPMYTSQLQSLFVRRNELTKQETWAIVKTVLLGGLTSLPIIFIFLFFDMSACEKVSFTVESVSFIPSTATWHVDFLVKNPFSFKCPINYDRDNVYAKLGPLNAVVLNTTHARRRTSSFSVDFVTEGNYQNDVVVSAPPRVFELDIKLSAKTKYYLFGRFRNLDVRCQNLNLGHEKIKCHSSFKTLKELCF